MKPSELIKKLQPFCRGEGYEHEEPTILIATDSPLPVVPNRAEIWEVNKGPDGYPFLLIYKTFKPKT